MKALRLFIRLSRPLFLIGGAILYALGAGIAHYLGATIDWGVYALGQAWVALLQLSALYLNEYYDTLAGTQNTNRTNLVGANGVLSEGKLQRRHVLLAALGCLAVLASLTALFITQVKPVPAVYLVMGLAFLGAFFYSTPPVKLETSGYGELLTSVLVVFLAPTLAYLLQTGEMHLLVAMSAFPLTVLHLAMLLALELPDYAADLKFGRRTLMLRMGWQNGMTLHNLLILSAFLLVALARSFGFPWFAMLAGLLPLPVGLLQIWLMRSIANGVKPNWRLLVTVAVASFATMAYFIAVAFWTN